MTALSASSLAGAYVRRLKLGPLLEHLQDRQAMLPLRCQVRHADWQRLKPNESITLGHYLAFFEDVAAELGDPQLGARLGLNSRSSLLSPLRELFLSGQTLHDALLELNRSTSALQGGTQTQLRIDHDRVYISYQLPRCPGTDNRQDVEFSLCMLIRILQLRLGEHWRPQEIRLCHALDETDRLALARLLDSPLVDAAESNCIVFAAHWLSHACALQGCSEDVLSFFREHIHALCTDQGASSFHDKVRRLLEQHMGEQAPSLELVASRLYLSPRSVQRRLAQEQVVFSDLLEQVRHALALERMRQPGTRIDNLADSLGYADSAAFSKAFKRWTGLSPLRYRRQFLF
ncbi:AraC family transcriptional regulator [Pseudomonas sp. Fl4BN1]|uniref:AraC family transcriptional regulator n=1 Tax=Pseudomonas sp. Fl4BN1 TaxID=2697651 RepID=UPI001378AA5D|nr:AraC family transcriptional regulator [Pseudomonas sp. Fl4BN1]NBF09176.1 helix-turn-helix domain-containing protein [Pseudomonas sp. Fl4BN1]